MSHSSDDSFSPRSREELLEFVYRRGRRLRRRAALVRAVAVSAALVFVVGVVGAAFGDDDTSDRVRAADPSGEEPAPEDTDDEADDADNETETGDGVSDDDDTPETSTSTTTTLVCRNSADKACGPFYWDPEPEPDRELTLDVVSVRDDDGNDYLQGGAATVPPGVSVTFTVRAHDPDGFVAESSNYHAAFGDGAEEPAPDGTYMCGVPPRYGPWTPPEPESHERTWSFTHAYDEQGEYVFEVEYTGVECGSPYETYGTVTERLDVEVVTETTTTTSPLPV